MWLTFVTGVQLNAEPSLGHAGETFLLLSLGKLLGIGVACIPTDKNMLFFFSFFLLVTEIKKK